MPAADVEVDDAWLEFGLMPWRHLDEEVRFGAGWVLAGQPTVPEEMSSALTAAGFTPIHQAHQRFYRFKHPAELLGEHTLDAQVDVLREWVEDAFSDVEQALREASRARDSSGTDT